jgi:hypothetical protein
MGKSKEPQFEIVIQVDTNDADYNTSYNKISKSNLEKIKPLIKAIKKFKPYTVSLPPKYGYSNRTWDHHANWPSGECQRDDLGEKSPRNLYAGVVSEDVFEMFEELLPYGEHGFHTIESIEVTPYVKKTKLL